MQTSQRCKCEQIIIFSKIPNKKMGRDSKLKQNRVFFNFKKMESWPTLLSHFRWLSYEEPPLQKWLLIIYASVSAIV